MQRYFDIRKGIMLGFFNGREQYDELIEPRLHFLHCRKSAERLARGIVELMGSKEADSDPEEDLA